MPPPTAWATEGSRMNRSSNTRMRLLPALAPVLLALAVAGCGGGASTAENPVTQPPTPSGYTGPPPASQDVQAFKLNVWDNLMTSNRCGQCHGTGGQVPSFVRGDDINLAYEAANGVVNLGSPADSMMVTKVGGGHNCWLAADSACGDQLTVWIRNWAGQTLGGTRGAPLQPPPIKEVGDSKSFPAGSALFGSTVYPLLDEYCSRCHSSGSSTSPTPRCARRSTSIRQSSHASWCACAPSSTTAGLTAPRPRMPWRRRSRTSRTACRSRRSTRTS